MESAALDFVSVVEGLKVGPFTYGLTERRGRWSITFDSRFSEGPSLSTKLDFAPMPWLEPVEATWVPMKIHEQMSWPGLFQGNMIF